MPPRKQRRVEAADECRNDACSVCHRTSTELYPVQLQPLLAHQSFSGRIVKRHFGDKSGMVEGRNVCQPCSHYTCPRKAEERNGSWSVAWPAVIWIFLSKAGYVSPNHFMRFLPSTLREFWRDSVHQWTDAMRAASNVEADFRDVTYLVTDFRSKVSCGMLEDLISVLNTNPFPVVRCPVGCFMFVDDFLRGRLDTMTASHYLAGICPQFRAFKADASSLSGARSDWTVPYRDLDWLVTPCLVFTEEEGLCILKCAKSMHSGCNQQWIHVPTHPVLKNKAPLAADVLAPVVVSANNVRDGRTNAHSTSFPVFMQVGSTLGLSTFRLTAKHPVYQMNDDIALAMGLTLNHRPDILHHSKQSRYLADKISTFSEHYLRHSARPTHDDIIRHLSGGSMVYTEEAHLLSEVYNARIACVEGNEPADGPCTPNPKDCIVVVHPADSRGHEPFVLQAKQFHNEPNMLGPVAYSVLNILVHSSHLFEALLNSLWRSNAGNVDLQRALAEAVKKITYSSPYSDSCPLSLEGRSKIKRLIENVDAGDRPEAQIVTALCRVCQRILYLNEASLEGVLATLIHTEEHNFVLRRENGPLPLFPMELVERKWILMMGITVDVEFRLTFRWSTTSAWQFTGTREHRDAPGNHRILVYVRQHRIDFARKTVIDRCSGQSTVRCLHHDYLLIRQPTGCGMSCSVNICSRVLHWRCPHGFGQTQCPVGLCQRHFKDTIRSNIEGTVTVAQYGPQPIPVTQVRCANGKTTEVYSDEHDIYSDDNSYEVMFHDPEQDAEQNDGFDDPSNIYPIGDTNESDICPTSTSTSTRPKFIAEESSSTSGHFYLNSCLRIMARSKLMRKPPIATLQILQNICSKSPEWEIPLVYPEAMLFPRIFWSMIGHSVVGALPAVSYSNVTDHVGLKNLATVKDHMTARLKDGSLLTSHDPNYLQFAFNLMLNSALNRNSAVVACHRGLEGLTREGASLRPESQEEILKFDEMDARREVNKLVSLLRTEGAWHYFLTLTCNDSETLGVWPIRKAIERHASSGGSESVDCLLQNYSVILTRAWERTVYYIWNYITTSREQPLGPVKNDWMRFEFQSAGALGNRPHVHGGITLHEEPLSRTLSRVRCSNSSMWCEEAGTDVETLRRQGIVVDMRDYFHLQELAAKLQQHSCQQAGGRCQKRRARDDTLICRVPRHPPSCQYSFEDHGPLYSSETYAKLAYLGLAMPCACANHWNTGNEFQAGMWRYPADADEHFVPTVPRLFVALKASTNVQVCDRKFQVSYLAKYAGGMDERRPVTMTSSHSADQIHVEAHSQVNAKISGQFIHPLNQQSSSLSCEIALTEMIWFSLKFPYVVSSCDYVHASTKPPEYRAAVVKHRKQHIDEREVREGGGGMPDTVSSRLRFPQWRHFTPSQVSTIIAYEHGDFYLDNTSSFSVRPPELVIFSKVELYLRWFTWRKDKKAALHPQRHMSHWIDGAGRCVRLRHAHVRDAAQFIQSLTTSNHVEIAPVAVDLYVSIFNVLVNTHEQPIVDNEPMNQVYNRFVDAAKKKRNVVVFTAPAPSYISNFLVHVLISMGEFVTEADLFRGPDMVAAFRRAGLVQGADIQEDDVKNIARQYVRHQLLWLPIGSRTFSRRLSDMLDGLTRMLLGGEVVHEALPIVNEHEIIDATRNKVIANEKTMRDTAIDILSGESIPNFPVAEAFKNGAVVFQPSIIRTDNQSQESFLEQSLALQKCVAAIDSICEEPRRGPCNLLLVGPPGCGKTHVLLIANTYAVSKIRRTLLVAVTSERSRRLGGQHLHMVFCLPVMQVHFCTVNGIASKTLVNLAKNPLRLAILQRLEIMFFEEIGLLSAEMFAVVDIVLRTVRKSDVVLGGLVMIGTGDPRQLKPVHGSPLWCSHHMICSFNIFAMRHFVRARQDEDLQRVISILRLVSCTDEQQEAFTAIIRKRCIPAMCVSSWSDVPPNVLRIVGTKQACEEIVQNYLSEKECDPTIKCAVFCSRDESETGSGGWATANATVVKKLSNMCLEPRRLVLFLGQIVRLTYNNTTPTPRVPRFSQGQLCVVSRLPSADSLQLWLKLLPPGERRIDLNNLPDPAGCDVFSIVPSPAPTIVVSAGQTKARRTQYRITYYVCSTVHRALGETCSRIATQISMQTHKYRLWDKEQLLVLLSRVPSLDNITFVTTQPEDTLLAMVKLLQQQSAWSERIEHVLSAIDTATDAPGVICHRPLPLQCATEYHFPNADVGYVYMLVSTKDSKFAYVGETVNIKKRLQQHNSGQGATFTRNSYLMPWACFVLVYHFPGSGRDTQNVSARKRFENHWHRLNADDRLPDTRSMLTNGRVVFNIFRRQYPHLIWEEFAHIRPRN